MNKQWIFLVIGLAAGFGLASWWMSSSAETELKNEQAQEAASGTVWTCSMHPQIRSEEAGLCPICEMDLIPLEEDSGSDPLTFSMTEESIRLAQLETMKIGSASGAGGLLEVSGKIEVNEDRSVRIVSYFPGKVETLHYQSVGAYVPKGAIVAKVFAPDLRIAQQELIRTYERREEQPELFRAAVKKMEYWQVDSSVIMEIASSGEEQVYLPVYAAHSGYIKSIQVKEGAFLNRGSVLFEISDLSSVWVSLDVHESQLNRVKNGQSFSFQTLASDQVYQARVDYIDPFVDRQKRTATVRATVVNSGRKFKPGMLVNAFLPFQSGDSKASQLMLPATAVLWTGERSVVYVQDEESDVPSFRYTEVVLGSKEGNQYPVLSGLSEGDRVVVQGAFTLDAAAQLNNKKSMINQWVEGGGNPILQRVKLNPVAKEKSAQLLDHYVQLKEYLVQADSIAAAQSGKELTRKVQSFQESLKNTDAKGWIAANMKEFRSAAQRIEVSKDIESQRLAFETLSNILIEWVTHIEMGAQVMYVQHCPMAFDDQGADWISYEEGIKNPYFGDRMLKCGITESIIRNQ